jgi:hypothetical protein
MLNIKIILLILLPLAGLAGAYAAWSHQQHATAAAVKQGVTRLVVPDTAKEIREFKDR